MCHGTSSIPRWSWYLFHFCQLVPKSGSTRPWNFSIFKIRIFRINPSHTKETRDVEKATQTGEKKNRQRKGQLERMSTVFEPLGDMSTLFEDCVCHHSRFAKFVSTKTRKFQRMAKSNAKRRDDRRVEDELDVSEDSSATTPRRPSRSVQLQSRSPALRPGISYTLDDCRG